MNGAERWAAGATVLPDLARAHRERPFWQELVERWGWRLVVDAGCGGGFHLGLLTALGVTVVGFDRSVTALSVAPRGSVAAADLLSPPLAAGRADGVLCLGNTLSLLADRSAQRQALAALVSLVRPGGQVLVQGEDAGVLTAGGPLVRTRMLADGRVHVRTFFPTGRKVTMAVGILHPGGEAAASTASILPTGPRSLNRLARGLSLTRLPLGEPPSSSPATWWLLWGQT